MFLVSAKSPVPLSEDKTIDSLLPDRPDVPEMCITMKRYKELELFTHFWFTAFPATSNLLSLTALSDSAKRRATTIPASLSPPELHHGTEQIVKLLVMLKVFPKGGF